MPKYDYDLIVIGAGAGGLTASTFAGQSAAKTLLIEKEENLGGDCLHYGCVPSKSLIKSAYAYNVMRHAQDYGLPKVDLPRVDYKQISRRIEGIINVIQEHDEPAYLKDKFNVETKFGQPKFIDNHTIQLGGKTLSSRYFVIATGSSPFIPPIEGLESVPYLTNMNVFKMDSLPESVIVLGGGPIGAEIAQALNRLGSQVTVVEFLPCILPKEDDDVSCYVHAVLEQEGIQFFVGSKAVKVEKAGGGIKLDVETDGKVRTLQAQALLVATGRRANVGGMELEKAGVKYERGIKTNAKMQTTAKNIYAAGDVCETLPFTHVASYEAVVAIYNCILKIPKKADYSRTPWCTYTDPEVASIGYNETRAKEAKIAHKVHKTEFKRNDRALAESETAGFIKIIINSKGAPIGVQIVGFHAGELIHEWVPVLNGKVKLGTISDAIHAYPTLSEINKNATVEYLVSTIPPWTKKLTKFLFGYQGKV